MGWDNPAMPWREMERRLSGRQPPPDRADAPVSRKRKRTAIDVERPAQPVTPYAELHAHSDFSFLDGASSPEQLVAEAIRLGLHALALTDHDGFYGAPAFAESAKLQQRHGLLTGYGAELSLGLTRPQLGQADPEGTHLLVLARGVEGYHRLAAAMTEAHLRGDEKGRPLYDLDELAERAGGHWLVLTGCRKGAVRQALRAAPDRAEDELVRLAERFGRDNVVVELIDHGGPRDTRENDALAALAARQRLPVVATNNVHYATPPGHRLAASMAAIRARRSVAELAGWLPLSGTAHLRSGDEMARIFARYPGAVARSVELADELAFDLRAAKPELPTRGIPEGRTAIQHLRGLTRAGFARQYHREPAALRVAARERIAYELDVIEQKNFAGYFVIVHDIVAEARRLGILCQGRGSAAASAVCYALGVTAIDPVFYGLPFARFISKYRDEEPDIDVDFDSDRREEVIQWVYDTYGRRNAAQVANVISYRPKMAIRDAAKALGYSPGQQDAWSKHLRGWHDVDSAEVDAPAPVVDLARQLMRSPRHLGIHSGGMVLTERPIGEVVPIERARREKRTVLQWDKDACEYMGLVKFDLLGLGMIGALDHMLRMTAEHLGERWTLADIPKEEPAVYDMLCRADAIGVFQVESRAQIGTLPRLLPRCFYDLAIEIALIRPGPIQGGAVHPYIRRATGKERVTYLDDSLIPALERTRGVPLFQEQLIQMGQILGDLDPNDADLLRRAMGSKRGLERIESLQRKLFEGMRAKGMDERAIEAVYLQIQSFAHFGFAESHALSFAKLVYASSWFKLHYPAAFLAGLLRAQPMGFYSAQSLVGDARRHGVEVLRPDLTRSGVDAGLELVDEAAPRPAGRADCLRDHQPTDWVAGTPDPTPEHRRDTAFGVRLGLAAVRGIGPEAAKRIVTARAERPFRDPLDLSRRAGLESRQLEALATAGAFASFGLDRRQALWQAGWTESAGHLEGVRLDIEGPTLPGLTAVEETLSDLWATDISVAGHPFGHLRGRLRELGLLSVAELAEVDHGRRVVVAGLVTHRQAPSTAGGVTFLNLEDETGMLNVVCSTGLWTRHRQIALSAAGLVVRGRLERSGEKYEGSMNLMADRLAPLSDLHPTAALALQQRHRSRDFH